MKARRQLEHNAWGFVEYQRSAARTDCLPMLKLMLCAVVEECNGIHEMQTRQFKASLR
jgi:hypothetical protein